MEIGKETRTSEESEATDAEMSLIDAAVAGGVEAFASLYDRYMNRVYRYVYYRIGNRTDAEDLTQQVFLNAWKAIGRYKRTGASFIAWLLIIAHNLVISFMRRAREVPLPDLEPEAEQRWANPEAETFGKLDRLTVRRAILRLKPEQQQVITMRYMEELPYSDISAALGKSEGNVRIILHRGIVELRRLLAEEVGS